MKFYSVILLFLTLTVVGPQSSTGSLRVQFITSANQPLQKAAVRIRFQTSSPRRYPIYIQTTTDSSGFVFIQELPALPVKIHLEAAGFDDYSADVNIKAGETTTVAARLEPVEELAFERLSAEQARIFSQACTQSEFLNVQFPRYSFENEQQWTALWSELRLAAPPVDFQKWRVVALITRNSNEVGGPPKTRRITYNPARKLTRIRRDSSGIPAEIRLPIETCAAEFVLIPPRAGDVTFR